MQNLKTSNIIESRIFLTIELDFRIRNFIIRIRKNILEFNNFNIFKNNNLNFRKLQFQK